MATGTFLFGNDPVFPDWPGVGIAHHAKLIGNWFSNVAETVRVPTAVSGLQEEGKELQPLRPKFESIYKDNDGLSFLLRGWHNQRVTIESSTDFRTWTPVQTNQMDLPSAEYPGPHPLN